MYRFYTSAAQNVDSEAYRKKQEADRLRAAEKFMVIGSGSATCKVSHSQQRHRCSLATAVVLLR